MGEQRFAPYFLSVTKASVAGASNVRGVFQRCSAATVLQDRPSCSKRRALTPSEIMSPPPPANFEALADQSRTLLSVFIAGGHEAVAPPIIQPAGVFLDVLGEALRGRTYVFSDPDGQELCLRPDLTVPTCRLYLERHPQADRQAHYCYNGPAFRYQPAGADAAHPREFRQAGIEAFGATDREDADARTLTLVLLALQQSGLRSVPEITEGMLAIAADAKAKPLQQSTAALIEDYLEVKSYADQAPARLRALIDKPQGRFAAAVDAFERRSALLNASGVKLSEVPFSGEFGRNVAYYSGFVFEVLALSLGAASPVAGGGRYDGLLRA